MNIDAWLGNAFPLSAWVDDHALGVDTAAIIADRPVSITVTRGATTLSAQTVRLEGTGTGRPVLGADGTTTHTITAVVIGYRNHPTITDTNLQPGDRFVVSSVLYEVIMVEPGLTTGLHAYCEAKR